MKSNSKKNKIIESGFILMDNKGYFGTGISNIISLAEIPKGSFYHYFESKEQFTIEIINYYAERIVSNIDLCLKDTKISPIDRIIELYTNYSNNVTDINKSPNGSFASKISQEAGAEFPEIKRASTNVYNRIRDLHVTCLEEAINSGHLSKDVDPVKLSDFIIYGWEGAIVRMKGSKSTKSLFIFTEMLEKVLLKCKN